MKQLFLLIGLISISLSSFSQINKNSNTVFILNKTDYLTKSENQKTIGWTLLGAGAVSVLVGSIWANKEVESKGIFNANFDMQAFLIIGGALSAVASIPFFIASNRNRNKENRTTAKFNFEILDGRSKLKGIKYYPSVSFKLKF